MNKKIIFCAMTSVLSNTAWAQTPTPVPRSDGPLTTVGGGVFGANRRVITAPNGYNGVRGSFTVPNFRVPNSFYAPSTGDGGTIITDGNSANSKPGFYLGCELDPGKLEVDAGVIWEPRPITTVDAQAPGIFSERVLGVFFGLPEVPVVDEPMEPGLDPVKRTGKGEGLAAQIGHARAQGVVCPLDL